MNSRALALVLLVILPGIAFGSVSAYFLLTDWAALKASDQYYKKLVDSPYSTMRDLFIADAAQNKHRINCFAEGVGILLGGVMLSIGVHGLCLLPQRKSP